MPSTNEQEPILIWGAGAIGGALGAAFLRDGREVVFVDTDPAHVAALNAQGLSIEGPLHQDCQPARACLPADLVGEFARVFLCVKAHHTRAACEALAPHLAPGGVVVSAQNGLNERVIARILGPGRTMGCFVNFGADYLGPGVIHHGGRGAVVLGELDGRVTPRARALHRLLRGFEPEAVLTDNIWGYLWGKMVYGTLLYATALTNESIADALEAPAFRPVLAALACEVAAVARAEGVTLMGFDGFDPGAFRASAGPEELAESFARMVAHNRRSAKSHSGIWRDLAVRRRPTEVDAQIAPLIGIGAEHGVAAPITRRLVAMIHEIETGARPLDGANLMQLAAETLPQPLAASSQS